MTDKKNIRKEEIMMRIRNFQSEIKKSGIEGSFILQKTDMYYFSGTSQDGTLYIPTHGEPLLMIRKEYLRAIEETPYEEVYHLKSMSDSKKCMMDKGYTLPRKAGLEFDSLPVQLYLRFKEIFPETEFVDITNHLKKVRMIKSPYEIEMMRKASEFTVAGFEWIEKNLREGMTEMETAMGVEIAMREAGHDGNIRLRDWNLKGFITSGNVLSGINGLIPSFANTTTGGQGSSPVIPYGPSRKQIKKGEIILLDVCTSYMGYVIDTTRIYALKNLNPEAREAHEAALDILKTILENLRIGGQSEEIYNIALKRAEELSYINNFMGYKSKAPYVGHGVGLELNEFPVLGKGMDFILEENMTVAVEPKIFLPEIGVVGVENTYLIGRDKPISFVSAPEEIIIL